MLMLLATKPHLMVMMMGMSMAMVMLVEVATMMMLLLFSGQPLFMQRQAETCVVPAYMHDHDGHVSQVPCTLQQRLWPLQPLRSTCCPCTPARGGLTPTCCNGDPATSRGAS